MLESQYLDHLRLLDQFPHRKSNQYHSSSTVETPNSQLSHEDHENIIEMPSGFYRQVTYNEQLQAYVFLHFNARVPARRLHVCHLS